MYTYGDNCAIRIQYGPTNDGDYYIDEKFNEVKETYSKDNYQTLAQEIRINSNVWSGLKIIEFKEDATGTGGYSQTEKYKFIAIIYKGNFYTITYSNLKDDTSWHICQLDPARPRDDENATDPADWVLGKFTDTQLVEIKKAVSGIMCCLVRK